MDFSDVIIKALGLQDVALEKIEQRPEDLSLTVFVRQDRITPIRFHDLRATFITNMLAQGVPISKVMAIVGHSQMNTTDGYNRRAGIGLEGATNQLGYEIPTFDDSQVVAMSKFRKAQSAPTGR